MAALNFDENHLLVHADGDTGDQCADSCRYVYATWLNGVLDLETLSAILHHLLPLPGIGRRSPRIWDDPSDWSHDQQDPLVILLEATGNYGALSAIEKRHRTRGPFAWRYQNIDWALWDRQNLYNPKKRSKKGDLLLLLQSIFRVIDSYLRPDGSVGADQNHMMMLMQAGKNGHSKYSELARSIFCYRRGSPLFSLRYYYRTDNYGVAIEWEKPVRQLIMGEK